MGCCGSLNVIRQRYTFISRVQLTSWMIQGEGSCWKRSVLWNLGNLFWVCSAPSLAVDLDPIAMHTTIPKAPHAPWAAAFGWLLSHAYSWDTNLWLRILSLSFSQALLSCSVTGDSMSLCAYTHLDNVLHYFSFFVLHWSNSTVAAELCATPGPVWKTDDSIFFSQQRCLLFFYLCEIVPCWSPKWCILFTVSVLVENFFTPQYF